MLRRNLLTIVFYILSSTICCADSVTSYVSKDGYFRFDLPPGWTQIPQNVLDASMQTMEELGAQLPDRYEAAFQLKGREWFDGPYIYARSNKSGRVGEKYLKDSTISSESVATALQSMAPFLGVKSDGKVVFDSKRKLLLSIIDANPPGAGPMTSATAQFLTADGFFALSIFCPAADWPKYREVFDNMLLSAVIADRHRYQVLDKVYRVGATWTATDGLFRVNVPEGWFEIPKQQVGEFVAGFQAFDATTIFYPYMLIQRAEGSEPSLSNWDDVLKSIESGAFATQFSTDSGPAQVVRVNDKKRIVSVKATYSIQGVGLVTSIKHIAIGKDFVVAIHCFQTDDLFEDTNHLFMDIGDHMEISEAAILPQGSFFSSARAFLPSFQWVLTILAVGIYVVYSIYRGRSKGIRP